MFFTSLLLISMCISTYTADKTKSRGKTYSGAKIKLQFNDKDKTVKEYPKEDVQVFTFIKNIIEDLGIEVDQSIPVPMTAVKFENILKFEQFLEGQNTDNIHTLEEEVKKTFATWNTDTIKHLLFGIDYVTANSDTQSEKILKLVAVRLFVDILKKDDLPYDTGDMSSGLQELIAGTLLADMILDTSLQHNSQKLLVEGQMPTISVQASDYHIAGYGFRGMNDWLKIFQTTTYDKAQSGEEIDLPIAMTYDSNCFGITPDDQYVYAMGSEKDKITAVLYKQKTGELKQKIVTKELLLRLHTSLRDENTPIPTIENLSKSEYSMVYDKKRELFCFTFMLVDTVNSYGTLFFASCTFDSEFTAHADRKVFKQFLEKLENIDNKKGSDYEKQLKEHREYNRAINWQLIDGYLIGITDFNKPGLMCLLPQKNQEFVLHTLTYDIKQRKWSSSGPTPPHFISLEYPMSLKGYSQKEIMSVTAYEDSFIPDYEKILNNAIALSGKKFTETHGVTVKNKFDTANLRCITIFNPYVYVLNIIHPSLRNIIEFMNNNPEAKTIANAWYAYHASKKSNQWKKKDNDFLAEENISDFIVTQYPLALDAQKITPQPKEDVRKKVLASTRAMTQKELLPEKKAEQESLVPKITSTSKPIIAAKKAAAMNIVLEPVKEESGPVKKLASAVITRKKPPLEPKALEPELKIQQMSKTPPSNPKVLQPIAIEQREMEKPVIKSTTLQEPVEQPKQEVTTVSAAPRGFIQTAIQKTREFFNYIVNSIKFW